MVYTQTLPQVRRGTEKWYNPNLGLYLQLFCSNPHASASANLYANGCKCKNGLNSRPLCFCSQTISPSSRSLSPSSIKDRRRLGRITCLPDFDMDEWFSNHPALRARHRRCLRLPTDSFPSFHKSQPPIVQLNPVRVDSLLLFHPC